MYDRKYLIGLSFAALGCLAAGTTPVLAAAHHSSHMKAKISMREARAIALKAYPGTIMKKELEHERGGTGLRYSFDIRQGQRWREVGIDAITGRVFENTSEGANPKD
jgi:uncharacterized membrane protein YkoI